MKRIVPSGLSAFAVAVSLGVMGCDSGGIETGVPADTKPQTTAPDPAKFGPINPPGVKKMPAASNSKDAAAPTPEASKGTTPK